MEPVLPHTLASDSQPGREARRQLRSENAVLRRFQIIGCAVEVYDLGIGIEECECSPPIPVAGLSYGTGIDQVTRCRLELQRD